MFVLLTTLSISLLSLARVVVLLIINIGLSQLSDVYGSLTSLYFFSSSLLRLSFFLLQCVSKSVCLLHDTDIPGWSTATAFEDPRERRPPALTRELTSTFDIPRPAVCIEVSLIVT